MTTTTLAITRITKNEQEEEEEEAGFGSGGIQRVVNPADIAEGGCGCDGAHLYLSPEDLDDVFYTLTGISSCTARSKDHFLAVVKRAIMDTRGLEARFEIASEVASQLGWGIVDCLLCGAVAGRAKMISSTWYAAVMQRDGQFAAGGDGKTSRRCLEGMRQVGHDDQLVISTKRAVDQHLDS